MARLDAEQLRGLAEALDGFGNAAGYGVNLSDGTLVEVSDGLEDVVYVSVSFDSENGIYVVNI